MRMNRSRYIIGTYEAKADRNKQSNFIGVKKQCSWISYLYPESRTKSHEKYNARFSVAGSSSRTFPTCSCELSYNANTTKWALDRQDPCRRNGYKGHRNKKFSKGLDDCS